VTRFSTRSRPRSSDAQHRCPLERIALRDRLLLLAKVAAGDLDVALIGQPTLARLVLGDQLEAGPLQMVGLGTTPGRRAAVKKAPEHVAPNADDTFIFANPNAEFDGLTLGIPAGIVREGEEYDMPRISIDVLILFLPIMAEKAVCCRAPLA
jgi:hypothetical protein